MQTFIHPLIQAPSGDGSSPMRPHLAVSECLNIECCCVDIAASICLHIGLAVFKHFSFRQICPSLLRPCCLGSSTVSLLNGCSRFSAGCVVSQRGVQWVPATKPRAIVVQEGTPSNYNVQLDCQYTQPSDDQYMYHVNVFKFQASVSATNSN